MIGNHKKNLKLLICILTAIFFVVLVKTAWISDDSAITLRTVLNFLNGYGPRFNLDERVQAFTHPLWFLLLSGGALVFKNVFASAFILSIIISIIAFWLLLSKFSKNYFIVLLIGSGLTFSKAFIDYSTSGLENPLSNLLILSSALMAVKFLDDHKERDLTYFFLTCSFLYLSRADLALILFPLALFLSYRKKSNLRELIVSVILGLSPILIWTIFSIYYYGFPFPNTAYAKLGTGISQHELIIQGARYFLHTIDRDPLTLFFISIGLYFAMQFSDEINKLLALGIFLYLIFILSIGGDFMEGRFFTAPLFTAAIILIRSNLDNQKIKIIGVVLFVLGMCGINATLFSDSRYSNTNVFSNGIADERGFYFQKYGLLTAKKGIFSVPRWEASEKRDVISICGGLGFSSIYSGPDIHFLDYCALADPLLARLPAKYEPNWRVGHFYRILPINYKASLKSGVNLLIDPLTRDYWESIRVITRNPLNDKNRIMEIIRFNLGDIKRPDFYLYRGVAKDMTGYKN